MEVTRIPLDLIPGSIGTEIPGLIRMDIARLGWRFQD